MLQNENFYEVQNTLKHDVDLNADIKESFEPRNSLH